MPTLLLVDGSSYLYRAFHALPELRNKAGEPTGAVYGVISMLRRLLADYKAQHPEMADESILRAVVFDAKGKTFREDWYPQYKAHRPPMPDELVQQIEPLHACIRASGWPLLMVEGVEADDVIGTLAAEATAQGMECLISTGDKDLAQLVNPQVTLVNTMTGERLDVAGVQQKFGVPPERIVDYLALVGDAVDGVPGVAKVGPKTAVKWLAQYGTLEGVMAHAAEIGGVVGENLRQALDFLPLGRRLLTVVCTVPLSPAQTVAQLLPQPVDRSQLIERYTRLEFKTWLREVSTDATAAADSLAPAAASSGSSVARGARSAQGWIAVAIRCCSIRPPLSSGWPGLKQHRSRRWIRKPPISILSWRSWWAFRLPSRRPPARWRRPICRWLMMPRGRLHSCQWRKPWNACGRGWSRSNMPSLASTSSSTVMCLPIMASRCAASWPIRCWNPMFWKATNRMIWAHWLRAIWGWPRCLMTRSPARVPGGFLSIR